MTSDITPRLAAGLSALTWAAERIMAESLARLPPPHAHSITSAVDAEMCCLTLQIDLPSLAVRVLADGPGWLAPQVLFALELPPKPNEH